MKEKACDGGRVVEFCDMAECAECGTRVRWDLRDDPFWGFQNCREKSPAAVTCQDFVDRLQDVITRAYPGAQRQDPITVEDVLTLADRLDTICEDTRDELDTAEGA